MRQKECSIYLMFSDLFIKLSCCYLIDNFIRNIYLPLLWAVGLSFDFTNLMTFNQGNFYDIFIYKGRVSLKFYFIYFNIIVLYKKKPVYFILITISFLCNLMYHINSFKKSRQVDPYELKSNLLWKYAKY